MSWQEEWVKVVSAYLFANEELKDLMLIPQEERSNIVYFLQKYFIEGVVTDTIVVNEKVRILYYETEGTDTLNPSVKNQYLHFDIYVKNEYIYGARQNYLLRREKLIFEKLKSILQNKKRFIGGMKLTCIADFALPPRCEGYVRYHVIFTYKKTY